MKIFFTYLLIKLSSSPKKSTKTHTLISKTIFHNSKINISRPSTDLGQWTGVDLANLMRMESTITTGSINASSSMQHRDDLNLITCQIPYVIPHASKTHGQMPWRHVVYCHARFANCVCQHHLTCAYLTVGAEVESMQQRQQAVHGFRQSDQY